VAVHAENRLGNDHTARSVLSLFEIGFELIEITMIVNEGLCARQSATVDNARVIEPIAENHVALARKRRENPRVRLKSGIEYQRRLGAFKSRKPIFQLFMEGHITGDQARRARATAVMIDRSFRRFRE